MEIWLNEISMFGSTRVVWLNIYHKKGKGITLLPQVSNLSNEIPILNANLQEKWTLGRENYLRVHTEFSE